VCHAVRARGSNRTHAHLMRAGAGASMIGFCQTVPVNDSGGMRREGTEPQRLDVHELFPRLIPGVLAPFDAGW